MNTYTSYMLITKDISRSLDRVEKQPTVQRDTDYYLANIGKVKTIDDFVKDTRLFNYAMKAHGLGEMTYAKAFMVKALKEGVTDTDSFANKLSDKRYKEFVITFNFAEFGETATMFTNAQQGTVDKYMRQTLEEQAGTDNAGVRLALYFQRKAPGLTNWYSVLADTALSSVVRTALGLPDSFAGTDIDQQVKYFQQKMNIEDFSNPKKLEGFLKRFTSLYEVKNPTSSASSTATILFGKPKTYGVSTDLMMAMQKLKF